MMKRKERHPTAFVSIGLILTSAIYANLINILKRLKHCKSFDTPFVDLKNKLEIFIDQFDVVSEAELV